MATRFTETMTPTDPKEIENAINSLKTYQSKANEYNLLVEDAKKRGIDLNSSDDPRTIVSSKMIQEAKDRTKKGKDGAISVIGNPLNRNTCAAGVCTIAANAGVNFDNMRGNFHTGLATDEKGRKIPQYNPLFSAQLDKSGYYELKPDEKPMPGDLVQYFEKVGEAGALNPYHLEFITDDKGEGRYGTFNNYGLFNEGKGESEVVDVRGTNSPDRGRGSTMNRFYRLTPEAAKSAVEKTAGPEGMKLIDKGKEYKDEFKKIRSSWLAGENDLSFGIILRGVSTKEPKEKVLDKALRFANNKDNVRAVINALYDESK
jgi:hypothetical protein